MPSTWPTPRVWTAGERVSASKMNELSTAFNVLYPHTAGGDVAYRDPAGNYLSKLAKPAGLGLFQNDAAGVPSYVTGGDAYDFLMKNSANTALAWGHPFLRYAHARNSGTQTIPATPSYLTCLWNTDVADVHGWHSTSSNTDRIIPTVAGVYRATCYIETNVGANNNAIETLIYKNGSGGTLIGAKRPTILANFDYKEQCFSYPVEMNGTTDYVNVLIGHNNAGSLTLGSGSWFVLHRMQ